MNRSQPGAMVFPKPGRALWALLIVMTSLGVLTALMAAWSPGGAVTFRWLACRLDRGFSDPWRLVTSGLLTNPEQWSHLLFSLVGLYFLGASLERRWGAWRFVRFLAVAVVLGNLTTMAIDAITPADAQARFHPAFVYGPAAALAGVAVAWSREFADSIVNLFFVVPVRGQTLLWVTIGICVLDLIYPSGLPEGVVAPFGGIVAGLLLGGTPSLARRTWLRARLLVLRRRSSGVHVQDLLASKPRRRPRPGAPPLRIVPGSGEEDLKKRAPTKDTRHLN
ncbi:MAG: rhomboid family intramembrane serine protease [Myxococcota bacterium]|nr:rhomboid family intramembrane serine protease [Myxococcota bacterium]